MATITFKRGKRKETPVSVITTWETLDGRAALSHSRSTMCRRLPRKSRSRIPDKFRVLVWDGYVWQIVSEHRTRSAAEQALLQVHQPAEAVA